MTEGRTEENPPLSAWHRAAILYSVGPAGIRNHEATIRFGDETVKVDFLWRHWATRSGSYVQPFPNERQESWFTGVGGAFRHFGWVIEEALLDNDRGVVVRLRRRKTVMAGVAASHSARGCPPPNPCLAMSKGCRRGKYDYVTQVTYKRLSVGLWCRLAELPPGLHHCEAFSRTGSQHRYGRGGQGIHQEVRDDQVC